jgi:hypothetical protein
MIGAGLPLLPFWHKESVVLKEWIEIEVVDDKGRVADQYAGRHLKFDRERDKPSSP